MEESMRKRLAATKLRYEEIEKELSFMVAAMATHKA